MCNICKIFSVFLILYNSFVFAQKQVLVCDSQTSSPIQNVNVFSSSFNYITNNNGIAFIPFINLSDSVCFSHISYGKICLVYSKIPDTLYLTPKSLLTKEITVNAFINKPYDNSISININNFHKSTFSNLGDLIKADTDLFIKDYGGVSGIKSVSMRGLSSENTIVLFNEARINDLRTGMFDFSLISPLSINNVQIFKNGYNDSPFLTPGGIIKLSNQFLDYDNKILLGVKVNSDFFRSMFFNIKQNYNNLSFSINLERSFSSGNYLYYFNDKYFRRSNAFFSKTFLSNNLEYRTAKNIINFYTHFNFLKNGIPGYVVTNNTQSSIANNQSKSFFAVINNIYLINNNFSLLYNINFNYQNLLLNDPLKQLFANKTSQSSILNDFNTFAKIKYNSQNLLLLFGYELSVSKLKNELPTENNIFINIKHLSNKVFANSYFTYYNLPLLNKTDLFTTFTYETLNQTLIDKRTDKIFSYRFGFSFIPNLIKNLTLTSSFSKSYRTPSFNEQFYSSLYTIKFLNKEYYEGYEINLSYNYNSLKKFNLSYYNLIGKDKIVWIPTRQALQVPKNFANLRYSGIEASAEFSFSENLINILLLYSFNSAANKAKYYTNDFSYNKQLVYVPKHRINLNSTINYKNFSFTAYNLFTSERFYTTDNDPKNSLKPYYVCDISLAYNFNLFNFNNIINFSVFNLFNTKYFVIQSYPMPLRNYSLTYIMEIL